MIYDWLDKAIELYNKDFSYLKIGRELNIDRKLVSKVLKQHGYMPKYSFKNRNGVERTFDTWRKYKFNEHFFDIIDTEEKAYWLGFLYADGYVSSTNNTVELGLKESDKSHIEKFIASIDGDMPIRKKEKIIGDKIYVSYSVSITSSIFKNALINNGCVNNKSLVLKFPTKDIVPSELIHHFIRGYIDGDGCYYFGTNLYNGKNHSYKSHYISIDVAGTEDFLLGMIMSLKLHQNKLHTLHDYNDIPKKVSYSGKYAIDIINTIFKDANIYLDRKYERICNYLCRLGERLPR